MADGERIEVDTVTAKHFFVTDAEGNMKASLEANPDGSPNLRLFGNDGCVRFDCFVMDNRRPIVNINTESGVCKFAFGLTDTDIPFLEFYGKDQKSRYRLELIEREGGKIDIIQSKNTD
jgi:hypothetical protein